MPDDDTMLAQNTVDFRNEERKFGAGRGSDTKGAGSPDIPRPTNSGRAPSGVRAPSGATARAAVLPQAQAAARPDIPALLRELYECRYEHCLPCADRVRMIESEVRRLRTMVGETP